MPVFHIIGGNFSDTPKKSGYIHKFQEALCVLGPVATYLNSGSLLELREVLRELSSLSMSQLSAKTMDDLHVLFWFADISNDEDKLLPLISSICPTFVLVQSKNNRSLKYSKDELVQRMHISNAELLIEFTGDRPIKATVHTCSAITLQEQCDSIESTTSVINDYLLHLKQLQAPLKKDYTLSNKDGSFSTLNSNQSEVLIGPDHPGSFGFQRKNHIHEGIDIYAHENDTVFAMEDGVVVSLRPFTGEHVTKIGLVPSPWWHNTFCIMIKGLCGVVNYGELMPAPHLKEGSVIKKGQILGQIKSVLTKDKGRPMAMLHLERYTVNTTVPVAEWALKQKQPSCLLSPLNLLLTQGVSRD